MLVMHAFFSDMLCVSQLHVTCFSALSSVCQFHVVYVSAVSDVSNMCQ